MPMVYGLSLATAGNVTTSGSANTEVGTFSIKPGIRNAGLQALYVIGKGAGLTAISGIVHRIASFVTASTAGTGVTPAPKDPGMQAAKATVISGQTIAGSVRTNHLSIGCGAAGPGGWVAPNPDSLIVQQGGGISSADAINASGTTSLTFEWSAEMQE
jgi:hypothetical protein